MDETALRFEQLQTICRLCLCEEGPMTSLSSENFGFRKSYLRQIRQRPTSELSHKIFFLTSLQVSCDSMYFPTQICQKCNDLLQHFFLFKSQCLKNDAKIRDLLDNKERADTNTSLTTDSTSTPHYSDCASTSFVDLSNNKSQKRDISESVSKPLASEQSIQKEPKKPRTAQYHFCEANVDGYEDKPNSTKDPLGEESVSDSSHRQPDEKCVYIKQEFGDTNESSLTVSEKPSSSGKSTIIVEPDISGMRLCRSKPATRDKNKKLVQEVVCSACNQSFKKQTLLDKHFNICLARDLSCQCCSQNFKSQKLLDKHVQNKHTDNSDYLCYFCGLVFNNSYKLLTHIRTHMPVDKVYNCDKCTKNFRKRQALINHLRSAHSENTYMCNLCGSQLSSLPGLKLHVRTIHTHRKVDRILKCPLCPKMFARQQYVVRHMRSHTGETPYNCKYCDRSFTLRWNHIQHERLHTGEKRYKCEICNKCFTHNVSKKNHMKYHKDVPGVNYVPPVKRKKTETHQ